MKRSKASYKNREEQAKSLLNSVMAGRRYPIFVIAIPTEVDGPEYALVGPGGTMLPEAAYLVIREVMHSLQEEIAEAKRTRIETRGRPSS